MSELYRCECARMQVANENDQNAVLKAGTDASREERRGIEGGGMPTTTECRYGEGLCVNDLGKAKKEDNGKTVKPRRHNRSGFFLGRKAPP